MVGVVKDLLIGVDRYNFYSVEEEWLVQFYDINVVMFYIDDLFH